MTAYLLVQGRITDPETYVPCRDAAARTLRTYDGTVFSLAGGNNPADGAALEGDAPEGATPVAFADGDQALMWYRGQEYSAARTRRRNATEVSLLLFDALD